MSQASEIDVNRLWQWVTTRVKAQTNSPGLWRSMEAAHPIVVEGNLVVLGFGPEQSHMRGLLLDNRHQRMIEQVMETGTRKKYQLRIIDGETLADWESFKSHAEEVQRLAQASRAPKTTAPSAGAAPGATDSSDTGTWEDIGEKLVRKIGTIPTRAMPSVQGRLLLEAVDTLAAAHPRLMPETPSEQDERALSRIMDRLAERLGTPASTISYLLYARLRQGS